MPSFYWSLFPPRSALRRLCLWGSLAFALLPAACFGQVGIINATTTNTTSTTHHETDIRNILPDAQSYSTRVLAFDGTNANVLFDSTTPNAPGSTAVAAAFQQATQILQNAGFNQITGPTLISSSSSTGAAVLFSNVSLGTTTTVSNTVNIGPGSILVGDDQGFTFFVAAGNSNINTNTHTERFFQNNFQATTLNMALFGFMGILVTAPATPAPSAASPAAPAGGVAATAATPPASSAASPAAHAGGVAAPAATPAAPAASVPAPINAPMSFLVVDLGSILSLALSAEPVALAQREAILQVSGVATRDVNGRLFRLRSGEFDEVAGQPGPAGGDGKSGKEISPPQPERPHWKSYVSGDYGYADQENVGRLAGFDGSTYAGTVGAELDATKHFTFGLAGTYLENRTDLGGGALGRLNIKGTAVSAYAAWHTGHFYLDGLYSFGRFEDELHRNTLLGSTAQADPYADSNVVELHTGYNFHLGRLVTGPLAGLRYTHSELDSYTEHGGGSADVSVGTQKNKLPRQ